MSLSCFFLLEFRLQQDNQDSGPAATLEEPEIQDHPGGRGGIDPADHPGNNSLLCSPWIWEPEFPSKGQHWWGLIGCLRHRWSLSGSVASSPVTQCIKETAPGSCEALARCLELLLQICLSINDGVQGGKSCSEDPLAFSDVTHKKTILMLCSKWQEVVPLQSHFAVSSAPLFDNSPCICAFILFD